MVQIKKIPPLSCPICKSTRVVRLFNNRKGKVFIATPNVVCYDCKRRVNMDTRKSVSVSIEEFEEKYIEKAQEQRIKREKKEG